MADMFKLSDIKAGHLLVVKNKDTDEEFNMTVVPAKGWRPSPFAAFLLPDVICTEDGDLACCGGGEYWPLACFDDNLREKTSDCVVVRVYGYTMPAQLLSNTTEGRELLWEREAEADAAEETEEPAWLNGKVVCVANKYSDSIPVSEFTVGKVYTVRGGCITSNTGWTSKLPAKDVEDLCAYIGRTFIPFVGEQE